MNRTEYIHEHLTSDLKASSCDAFVLSADQWRSTPHGRFRFGWMPPAVLRPGRFVTGICPELLAETTAALSDEELDHYLATIGAYMQAQMERSDLTADEVMAFVDNELYDQAPASLQLMSDVEVSALDNSLV